MLLFKNSQNGIATPKKIYKITETKSLYFYLKSKYFISMATDK